MNEGIVHSPYFFHELSPIVVGYQDIPKVSCNVGKTIINHPMFDGLYHPFMIFMVIWGTGYYCFNHIYDDHLGIFPVGWILIEAINANSALQLRKAIALAPRGERAQWLLCIQAMGTATKNRATFMGKMMNHWMDWTLGSRFSEPYWKSIG